MTDEDRLRQALHAYGDRVEPDPDTWERVQAGLARRRWPRILGVGVVAAAAMATAVVATLLVTGDDRPSTQVSIRPAATAPTVATTAVAPSTTASTTLDGHVRTQMPATVVAIRNGALTVFDATTGEHIRNLATLAPGSGVSFGSVVLSLDGKAAYYDLVEGGVSDIYAVNVTGGSPRLLRSQSGTHLALSPDGRSLVSAGGGAVFVLDVATREQREWRSSGGGLIPGPSAWTADSGALVIEEATTDALPALYRLELAAPSLEQAQRIGPRRGLPEGTGWRSPSLRGYDGLIGVIESCCSVEAGGRALVVVNPANGVGVGRSYLSIDAVRLTYDRSGDHMLLFTADGRLYRRSGGEAPIKVADGITAAAW
jgi:hypothetical protein